MWTYFKSWVNTASMPNEANLKDTIDIRFMEPATLVEITQNFFFQTNYIFLFFQYVWFKLGITSIRRCLSDVSKRMFSPLSALDLWTAVGGWCFPLLLLELFCWVIIGGDSTKSRGYNLVI